MARPKIICLCGSSRFWETFAEANRLETLRGHIVIGPGVNCKTDAEFLSMPPLVQVQIKRKLDALHRRKIDMADEVLVLNVEGYIGDSTREEIEYAEAQHKTIRYWSDRLVISIVKITSDAYPEYPMILKMPATPDAIEYAKQAMIDEQVSEPNFTVQYTTMPVDEFNALEEWCP